MFTSRKFIWFFMGLLATALILGACSLQSKPSVDNNPAATLTSAAETVSAQLDQGQGGINATSTAIAATVIAQIQLTQAASGTQVVQPTATLPANQPTNTPVPPTPVRVRTRQVSPLSILPAVSSSLSRPMKGVGCMGRLFG